MALIRLNKYLADNGIASRRKCDELIAEGEVMVDNKIVTELGTKVDPATQRVEVDGVVLRPEGERHRYYLLNKPTGVVCTNEKRELRRRAIDLITDKRRGRIYTVGRLDEDSTGIVLLTNDGELANLVSHPRYGVEKIYRAVVHGRIGVEALRKLRKGVWLAEGRASLGKVSIKSRTERRSTLFVTLREGKNRVVRRAFARVGHTVISLARVRVGNLTDRGLKVGHWRPLTRAEVDDLRELAQPTSRSRPSKLKKPGKAKPARPVKRRPRRDAGKRRR
ncbi:MAG: pseudouridine synthase [Planctomycetota bacterium]|nr:pseudouridine synthase [Planctomycetota bacterium]